MEKFEVTVNDYTPLKKTSHKEAILPLCHTGAKKVLTDVETILFTPSLKKQALKALTNKNRKINPDYFFRPIPLRNVRTLIKTLSSATVEVQPALVVSLRNGESIIFENETGGERVAIDRQKFEWTKKNTGADSFYMSPGGCYNPLVLKKGKKMVAAIQAVRRVLEHAPKKKDRQAA